jgi:hypothetical protein
MNITALLLNTGVAKHLQQFYVLNANVFVNELAQLRGKKTRSMVHAVDLAQICTYEKFVAITVERTNTERYSSTAPAGVRVSVLASLWLDTYRSVGSANRPDARLHLIRSDGYHGVVMANRYTENIAQSVKR